MWMSRRREVSRTVGSVVLLDCCVLSYTRARTLRAMRVGVFLLLCF